MRTCISAARAAVKSTSEKRAGEDSSRFLVADVRDEAEVKLAEKVDAQVRGNADVACVVDEEDGTGIGGWGLGEYNRDRNVTPDCLSLLLVSSLSALPALAYGLLFMYL